MIPPPNDYSNAFPANSVSPDSTQVRPDMTNQHHIPDAATKYILFQRTAYLTLPNNPLVKALRKVVPSISFSHLVQFEAKTRGAKVKNLYLHDMEMEFRSLKQHLPARCDRILDIGCGIAGIDIFLHQHFRDAGVEFYLLDRSQIEENVFYMYRDRAAFYNSLELAKEVLVNNRVPEERIHLLEANDKNEINTDQPMDLIFSLISWGFHYPVETYLDRAYELCSDQGAVILDVRKDTNGIDLLSRKFARTRTILESDKFVRVCANK